MVTPPPTPVILINYITEEAYTYPNASFTTDRIIEAAKSVSRRGGPVLQKGDRSWNDTLTAEELAQKEKLPLLKAVIIDFSSVNSFDSTALQVF